MSVEVCSENGSLGQFASNLGFTELIDASEEVPALKEFFALGYAANENDIQAVVKALHALDGDEDVTSTAKGLATLIDGKDLVFITNGLSDAPEGEEDEPNNTHAPTAVAAKAAVIPAIDAETDQSRNIDAGFAASPGTSQSSTVEVEPEHADHSDLQRVVHAFFQKQAAAAMDRVKHVKDLHKSKRKVRKADESDKDKILDAALGGMDWPALVGQVQPKLLEAGTFGVIQGLHQATVAGVGQVSAYIGKSQQLAAEYAKERAAEMVGMKWVDDELVENPNARWAISDTTRDDIRQLIADALSEETNIDDLAKRIEEAGAFSEARAEMVAQTEIARAQTEGVTGSWKQTGAVEKVRWSPSSLGPCPECTENVLAGSIPFGTPFPTGDIAPPQHPRCRCALIITKVRNREEKTQ